MSCLHMFYKMSRQLIHDTVEKVGIFSERSKLECVWRASGMFGHSRVWVTELMGVSATYPLGAYSVLHISNDNEPLGTRT